MSVHVSGVSGSSSHLYRADAEKVRVDAICAGVTGRTRAMSGVTASAMLTEPTPLNVPKAAAETLQAGVAAADASLMRSALAAAVRAAEMDTCDTATFLADADAVAAADAVADASLSVSVVGCDTAALHEIAASIVRTRRLSADTVAATWMSAAAKS